MVNNAGISGSAEQDFYSTEAWHRIMAVNATGVFFRLKYAIPAMVANGAGSIVNLSSIAGNHRQRACPHGLQRLKGASAARHAPCSVRQVRMRRSKMARSFARRPAQVRT